MLNSNLRYFIYGIWSRTLLPYWDKIESSRLGTRMVHGVLWSIGGAIISRGLMLIASIMVARLLGIQVYGEFGMIRSSVNMFLVFAGFGLGMTATKHVAEYRVVDPLRAGRIISLSELFAVGTGTLVAVSLYIFAPWVATYTINAPHLAEELRIGAFILVISAMNGAQTGALAGFEAFKAIAKINVAVGLLSFPLLVCGTYWGGLRGAVWALSANMLLNLLLNHLMLRHEAKRWKVPLSYNECLKEWPVLWRFSIPAALSGILVSPVLWTSNAMLVNQPDGYSQMGLFDAANQWRMAILFFPGVVGKIVLPILANLGGAGNILRYRKALKYNAVINCSGAIAVAVPVILLAQPIMRSYGENFEGGITALILLALSTILVALNNVVGQAIASKGRMWIGFSFNLLWAIVYLILSFYFIINGYGVTGLALANLLAYFAHSIWQTVYVYKVLLTKVR